MNQQKGLNISINYFIDGILLSYAQIFFSNKKWFGLCLLLLTCIHPLNALISVATVFIALAFGLLFNFNQHNLQTGVYTYNTLLVGLGIASVYQINQTTMVVMVIYALLSLFLSVILTNSFGKRGLAILTIPFLLCIWMLHISHNAYGNLETAIEQQHNLAFLQPVFTQFTSFIDRFPFADALHIFFKSLSAIFFIYNDLIGFLIALLLLFYSRISFSLVVWGFVIGAIFFRFFLGDYKVLIFEYMSFNFILIAIALGGFFVVPSWKAYLFQLFSVGLGCFFVSSFAEFFTPLNLPIYSLPFVVVVLLCLLAFQLRLHTNGIQLVTNQQYQPERNFYKSYFDTLRFQANTFYHIYLPVMGEWHIPQGINGGITHLEQWKYAWDFDIRNQEQKSYQNFGTELSDFYCYGLPIIAPCNGYIVALHDNINDNPIGGVNTDQNWGNTLVLKVDSGFYIQLSHFKSNSFQVKTGDYVYAGQILGNCGNSGRSPEPHIHFQMQITPDIGSQTIEYPIAYYLVKDKQNQLKFRSFDYPKQGETICNIIPEPNLQQAFTFLPNHTIFWQVEENETQREERWFIGVNALNKAYLYDEQTDSYAFFKNDGILFYFYDFIGNKNSLLFNFYLVMQKIMLANYKNVEVTDWIMPNYIYPKKIQWIQDFIAPFTQLFKGKFISKITSAEQAHSSEFRIETEVTTDTFGKSRKVLTSNLLVKDKQINTLEIIKGNKKTILKCTGIFAY